MKKFIFGTICMLAMTSCCNKVEIMDTVETTDSTVVVEEVIDTVIPCEI